MEEFPASKVHLQPDLLGSFPADVCPDITGQFGCGRRAKIKNSDLQWVGSGGGGGGVVEVSDSNPLRHPRLSFYQQQFPLQRTCYFFHISQPAKMCLKNRYFEERIHWVPLLIDGFWSEAPLVLLRDETIPSAIRDGNDRLFSGLSDHRHPCFRNLNSTLQWWRYFIVWVKYILGSFLWKPYGVSLSCCLSLFRRRGASELFPSPPWVTSKRLSYDLQTKWLFLKFICEHFQVVVTCISSLTLPWQPSFDSHVCQTVYLLH